jgi:hypothetical protein
MYSVVERPVQPQLFRVGKDDPVGEERQLGRQPTVEELHTHELAERTVNLTIARNPGFPISL